MSSLIVASSLTNSIRSGLRKVPCSGGGCATSASARNSSTGRRGVIRKLVSCAKPSCNRTRRTLQRRSFGVFKDFIFICLIATITYAQSLGCVIWCEGLAISSSQCNQQGEMRDSSPCWGVGQSLQMPNCSQLVELFQICLLRQPCKSCEHPRNIF